MFRKPTNIQVIKLIITEVGAQPTQYVRPYETSVSAQTLNSITERAITDGDGRLNNKMLTGIAGSFISPQATPECAVVIPGGWSESRIRFLLKLKCDFQIGSSTTIYVQGYTNFMGLSHSNAIAPDMQFFINSISNTTETLIQTNFGNERVERVIDSSHILSSNNWVSALQSDQQKMIRPEDIFNYMQHSHIPGMYGGNGKESIIDSRSVVRSDAVKSRRSNNIAGGYASEIIDAYIHGSNLTAYGQHETNVLGLARSEVIESQVHTDPFISAISNVTGMGERNCFTYSDLLKIDPNANNVTVRSVPGQTQLANSHGFNNMAGWQGSDRTTVVATILSQSVPSIMMDLMLTSLVIKSTNHDYTRQPTTVILSGNSFSNMNLVSNFDMFKRRFNSEIIKDITFDNQESYFLDMRIDLLGETWMSISIGNNQPVEYITPSYCDALFVPVLTRNNEVIQNITSDFEGIVSNVREANNWSSSDTMIRTSV